jgi:tetratricopeptide (TPR) repeat protein
MRAASQFAALGGAFLLALCPPLPAQLREPGSQLPRPAPVQRLAGRVLMEDGSRPSQPAVIELACGTTARVEGVADSKGNFSVIVGMSREPDYDAGGGRSMRGEADYTARRLSLCELRARMPGYLSTSLPLASLRQGDYVDVGTLVLKPFENSTGAMISVHSLQAPAEARRFHQQGLQALRQKKWDSALKHLQRAVQAYPQYADAWFGLGLAHHRQERVEQARAAYLEAARLDPQFIKPPFHLAVLASEQGQWEEAAVHTARVLELGSAAYPQAHYLHALACYRLGQWEEAEKSARYALARAPAGPRPRLDLLLGNILLARQDYQGAARSFRAFLEAAPEAPNAAAVRLMLEEAERRVILAAESKPQ